MTTIKVLGQIDEQHRLYAQVPPTVAPGQVEVLVIVPATDEESAAGRGKRLLSNAYQDQVPLEAGWNAALCQMGVRGEAAGAEAVQQAMTADGIRPEDKEFSREIVALRED